jgi:hypothetical protein
MPAKKKSSYKHASYRVFTKNKSFVTSALALVLLLIGVGSALALSQMSQDSRSNAKAVRDPSGFWYDDSKYAVRDPSGYWYDSRDVKPTTPKPTTTAKRDWRGFWYDDSKQAAVGTTAPSKTTVPAPATNTVTNNDAESGATKTSGSGSGSSGGSSGQQAASQSIFPNATAPLELVLVEQSEMSNGKYKSRLVTKLSVPDSSLTGSKVVGEIYKGSGSNRKVLHECYFDSWDDYILVSSDSTSRPANFCSNTTPNWKETYKGVVGQISSRQTTTNSKPLKECFDETNLNHFYVTTADGCQAYANSMTPRPTVRDSWTYGYIH